MHPGVPIDQGPQVGRHAREAIPSAARKRGAFLVAQGWSFKAKARVGVALARDLCLWT